MFLLSKRSRWCNITGPQILPYIHTLVVVYLLTTNYFLCFFKLAKDVYFLGQFVQWNLTNSCAICTCSLKESPVLNVLSQGKHQKLVGPWVFSCFFRTSFRENDLSQVLHEYFTSECIFMCLVFSFLFIIKPQMLQGSSMFKLNNQTNYPFHISREKKQALNLSNYR